MHVFAVILANLIDKIRDVAFLSQLHNGDWFHAYSAIIIPYFGINVIVLDFQYTRHIPH